MSEAGTSGQAPSAPSQHVIASIKYDENITKIIWPTSNSCDILEVTAIPSCKEASRFITKAQFRTAIFDKFKSLLAIRLMIKDEKENFKSEHAEKPKLSEFEKKNKIVVSFELVQSGRKIIHWKNDLESPFLSLDLNNDRQSAALANFVLEFILSAFRSNCSGES
jgi:hypothetical protein